MITGGNFEDSRKGLPGAAKKPHGHQAPMSQRTESHPLGTCPQLKREQRLKSKLSSQRHQPSAQLPVEITLRRQSSWMSKMCGRIALRRTREMIPVQYPNQLQGQTRDQGRTLVRTATPVQTPSPTCSCRLPGSPLNQGDEGIGRHNCSAGSSIRGNGLTRHSSFWLAKPSVLGLVRWTKVHLKAIALV